MPEVPAVTYAGAGCITGPNGEMVMPGEPIPKTWPLEYRQAFYDAGSTTKTKPPAAAALEALPGELVSPGPGPAEQIGPDAAEIERASRKDRP